MARAANMQALTNDFRAVYPGVVIYGIGDDDHKLRTSDHNEDDTPGSLAAQTDADNRPEHRAIDVMLGLAFAKENAYAAINSILADPIALARLRYIIFDGWIWSRNNGWRKAAYSGSNKHTSHIHFSGDVRDDENIASWPSIYNSREGSGMALTDEEINKIVRQVANAIMHESTDAGYARSLNSPLNKSIAQGMSSSNVQIRAAISIVDAKLATVVTALSGLADSGDITTVLERLTRIEDKLDAIFSGTGMSATDLRALVVGAVKQAQREGSDEE